MGAFSTAAMLLAATSAVAFAKKYQNQGAPRAGVINVHLVPHTHDDVGWLKTVDEYYYGDQNGIQRATVQNILNSVMKELAWDPARKFIYVEQAFFQRWWAEAEPQMVDLVKQVVANGQFEFINGGWSMHDEAAPGYADMIDQTTLGHRLILEQFNKTVSTTWQIDPFGHSGFAASMMSSPLAGFNAVFFARADYQDIASRQANGTSEFVWAPSPSQGLNAATLGGILMDGYGPPGGLDMAEWSSDSPVMDDPTLTNYNVGTVVELFVARAIDQASKYPNGTEFHVMFTMGSDFNYENANTWFENLDKLIHYVNQDGRVNTFYSTPSIYAKAKLATTKFTLKTDDLFPYADGPNAFWTGYLTSRAALKGYVRESSSVFHAARQLQVFTGGAADLSPSNPLYRFERSMGVLQHHDAVAGTEKQAVAYDYAMRLAWGRADADALIAAAIANLTGYSAGEFQGCDLTNVTICPALEAGQPTLVFIYNQKSQGDAAVPVRLSVGLPAGVASYSVYDVNANAVIAQLIPPTSVDTTLRREYYNYTSPVATSWLAFFAAAPSMGHSVYFITPAASVEAAPLTHVSQPIRMRVGESLRAQDQTITNGVVTLTISGASGRVSQYSNSQNGINTPFAQDFQYYRSSTGTPKDGQASGAYIFRPNVTNTFPVATGAVAVTIVTGPIINEAQQIFGNWSSQVIRLWANATTADFEFTVGPINWFDNWGKEIISLYSTPLVTNGTWYTDSNGRDSIIRKRNYRFSWNYTVNQPVSGNYAPVNAFIYTRDVNSGVTLTVNTDRTEAGASIQDGELELMVHRRLLADDQRGVGEPLNETGLDGRGLIVRGIHRVSIEPSVVAARVRRTALDDLMWRPIVNFAPLAGLTPAQWIAKYKAQASNLQVAVPSNVRILTTQSYGPGKLLLRIAHNYEVGDDPILSLNGTVTLANLFKGVTITDAVEMTITNAQPLSSVEPVTYQLTSGQDFTLPVLPAAPNGPLLTMAVAPMQIRTFMCTTV